MLDKGVRLGLEWVQGRAMVQAQTRKGKRKMFAYNIDRDLEGSAYLTRLEDAASLTFDGEAGAKVLAAFDDLEEKMIDNGFDWYVKEFNSLAASYF